jgi:hypothetical protein
MSRSKKPSKGSNKGPKKGQEKGQKKGPKNGTENGPKTREDPKKGARTIGASERQKKASKERGFQNSERKKEERKKSKKYKGRKGSKRAPESEPVVEKSGNQLQNEVLETVPKRENRAESPVDLVDGCHPAVIFESKLCRLLQTQS